MAITMVDSNSETSIGRETENWQRFESVLMQDDRIAFAKMMSDVKMYHAAFDKAPT